MCVFLVLWTKVASALEGFIFVCAGGSSGKALLWCVVEHAVFTH